ncbi:cytochrome C [Tenacibaculum maritimum]|uniref:cytochrome C n=1 Tax=Tenacibaculum maritimum TaxID=107401 RepID=UPI003875E183|nr:cytochrome C [Tenacibaculum maritimum]
MSKIGVNVRCLAALPFFSLLVSCHFNEKKDVYTAIKERELEVVSYSLSNSLQHDRLVKVVPKVNEVDSFFVYERKSNISKYKCSGCHSESLHKLKEKKIFIHKDIRFFHMDREVASCFNCHNKQDMDLLRSHTGKSIDFNKSYKVCAQCHQGEYKDWAIGAHGKQVGGWMPPRVSKTCVECHNPHSPKFHTKVPAYPVYLKRERSRK